MQNLAAVWFPPVRETRLLFKLDQRDISCLILCISIAVIAYVPLSCSQSAISSFRHTHKYIYIYIYFLGLNILCLVINESSDVSSHSFQRKDITHGSNIWDEKEIESRKKVFVELISWGLSFFFLFRKRWERFGLKI